MTTRELTVLLQGLAPVLREYGSAVAAQVAALKTGERALSARLGVLERATLDGHGIESAIGPPGPPGPEGKAGRDGRDGKDGFSGERGIDGKDGTPGRDGKDGSDGIGFPDLAFSFDADAKTFGVKAERDGRVKAATWVVPLTVYKGVYEAGTLYQPGDQVTHSGSQWTAKTETSERPGEDATAWQLSSKRGRDGKPGPQGEKGLDGRPGRDLTQMDDKGHKW